MKVIYNFLLAFVVNVVCAAAQMSVAHTTFLDYSAATPRNVVATTDGIFVVYDGGSVFKFSDDFEMLRECTELDQYYIHDLFEWQGFVCANSAEGDLFVAKPEGHFQRIANINSKYFVDKRNDLYLIEDGILYRGFKNGDQFDRSVVSLNFALNSNLKAFAIVGDTFVFASDKSNIIEFRQIDGPDISSLLTSSPPTNFFALSDGGIIVVEGSGSSAFVKGGTFREPELGYYKSDGRFYSLESVSGVEVAGKRGVTGLSFVNVNLPYRVFSIVETDTLHAVPVLDTTSSNLSTCHYHSDLWYAAGVFGRLVKSDRTKVLKDKNFTSNVSFVNLNGPVLIDGTKLAMMGGTHRGQIVSPALFSDEFDPSAIREIDTAIQSYRGQLMHYSMSPDSQECLVLEREVFYRDKHSSKFRVVDTTINFVTSPRSVYSLPDGVIICTSYFKGIEISTDWGQTWREFEVRGMAESLKHGIANGNIVYGLDYNQIRVFDFSRLEGDTIESPSISIGRSPVVRFEYADSNSVRFTRFIKDTNLAKFTTASIVKFITYTWRPETGHLDSVESLLSKPFTDDIQFARFCDTSYYWSYEQSRLISLHRGIVVVDTVISFESQRKFPGLRIDGAVMDSTGRWWLTSRSANLGVCIDVTKSNITSDVHDYPRVYVHSVYPNPTSNYLYVSIGRYSTADLKGLRLFVVDINGNEVLDLTQEVLPFPSPTSQQTVSANVSGLPNGVYLVVVKNSQSTNTKKVAIFR